MVTLTAEERASASYIKEESREWHIWHTRGNAVQRTGKYDEALYCYNQAEKAAETTDTVLQKSYLFLRMREPVWAIRYADRFAERFPRDSGPPAVRALAYCELGKNEDALREADRLAKGSLARQIVQAVIQSRKGDATGGNAAVIAAWIDNMKRHYSYPAAPRPEHLEQLEFLTWPTLPSDAQKILTEARLDPGSLRQKQ
jgi:tetratricopeptide (TPR) repeat protein